MPSKSPPWTRDEIILALDLYHRMGRRIPNPDDPPVLQVSRWLNLLPIHAPSVRAPNFRNPSGVVLKIANLRAFDKSTTSVGMSGGSRLDREIYEEFEDAPEQVAEAAREVLLRYGLGPKPLTKVATHRAAEEPPAYDSHWDRYALHVRLEQDLNAIAVRRNQTGLAVCEVCGFDFGRFYGSRGEGYIQFHHRVPLADLQYGRLPTAEDLHPVCANCHAMLHALDEPLTVEELKELVRAIQRSSVRELASRLNKSDA